jgi:threonine-phosphate decarboxylase
MKQLERYEMISKLNGGYYRYNFTDHAYLYNLYFPPESMISKLKDNIHNLVSNYPVGQSELASLVGKVINQPRNRIVVGNGASELIKIISGQIAARMIVPVPSFNEYANASTNGDVIEFPLDFPALQLNIDAFVDAASEEGADIAVVVSPNNPTSLLIPKSDIIRLSKELEAHDCKLIVDESFVDFAENPEEVSLEKEIEKYPNMTIIKSMSKAYGICGLRIGYMLTTDSKFADEIRARLHIWNVNGFAEEFLRLLPNYEHEFIQSCRQVRIDRDILYDDLCSIDEMTVFKPDANFVFCRLPDHAPNAMDVAEKLFVDHNILIKHCLEKTMPESDRYIRIASLTKEENYQLVKALREIVRSKETKNSI